MKRFLLLPAILLLSACSSSVTILHLTDYHSHATPFYAHGEREAAGIARAYAYVEPLSRRDDVIVLSGGDTMNLGAPPWSDAFGCVEWPWWNGIVDAMALGNHDADYGPEVFRECRASIDYPILGANVVDAAGNRPFLHEGKPYLVLERSGRRIGLFAVVGAEFPSLIRQATSPVDRVAFTDRTEVAREIVRALREEERVDAVVLFGHAHGEEDEALARAVPGIDLVLGTHSHKVLPLARIEGTSTWMTAGGQYLEHVARVDLTFRGVRLVAVEGGPVPMRARLPEDPEIARRVAHLQSQIVSDPRWAALFEPFGRLESDLPNDGVNEAVTGIGRFVMDAVRRASAADVALSTSSSFRGGLPAGEVSEASLLEVLPYDNAVLVYELSGSELAALLDRARSLRGTDSFVQLSGIGVDGDPGAKDTWRVATTDYLSRVSAKWKDLFEGRAAEDTGLRVRSIARAAIGP
jgi:5'-nucleotidase / UDP-sugar diphosphatase